ncbi:transmembrane protein 18 isoform X1 [Bufo gargarizans]|uniref:transmembrane protein 18 isoform X1 n=1 Tax=Bufo gargarizans TaxID=30331 RepID=UPI001CF5386C|nr:transmembrane protein 18 isoform X1 [Bufo gargarizans]
MEKEAGVWELLERVPVDWSEPWIIGLLGFHLLCFILTCLSFKCYKLQIALFFLMVGLVSCAEYINEVAAVNWKITKPAPRTLTRNMQLKVHQSESRKSIIPSSIAFIRRLYSRQQYFDSSGMFISLAFSAPLLCNTIIIVVHWVYKTLSVMTELKTLQKKRKAAKDSKKEK